MLPPTPLLFQLKTSPLLANSTFKVNMMGRRGFVSATETPRGLTLPSSPAAIDIVVPLKDLSTVEGTKAVLEAKISAQDISSVKWYCNDKQMTPSDRIQTVAKGAKQRLVFSRTHASDEGRYKLVVGKVDTTCKMTVESKMWTLVLFVVGDVTILLSVQRFTSSNPWRTESAQSLRMSPSPLKCPTLESTQSGPSGTSR